MLTFYYASAAGPQWRVWLALEHKQLPYELKTLSLTSGELKQPEFLAINPRGMVPAIVDGDFKLYESVAILEYLDLAYPDRPVFPRDPRRGAIARRIVQETDSYMGPAVRRLLQLTSAKSAPDSTELEAACSGVAHEFAIVDRALEGDWLAGELSAADFTMYPAFALLARARRGHPDLPLELTKRVTAWAERVEALPYFAKTIPPTWR